MKVRSTEKPDSENGDDVRSYASSPCYQHEIQPAASDYLSETELKQLLNRLLEGERAGARGLNELSRLVDEESVRLFTEKLAKDEAYFCAMLSRHVLKLGGTPTHAIGRFYSIFKDCTGLEDKLALLDRGQLSVVRTLNDAISRVENRSLRSDLIHMREVHIENIAYASQISLEREVKSDEQRRYWHSEYEAPIFQY